MAIPALQALSCCSEDGPFVCSGRHSKLSQRSCKSRSVYVVCQAQSSCERSWTLDQHPSSLFSVIDLQQQKEFLKKKHVYITSDRAGLREWIETPTLLQAEEDCYDGVIVDPRSLPLNADEFICSLRASILHWKVQRKRGIWLKLSSHLADFVPLAIKEGFQYHHAEPSHVMMTYWIPETPSTLPPNASHQVGIGAFVMNDRREVLAVQEKDGPLRGSGVWKMPTGLINQAEDLCVGAVREVKEETGVDTEFLQVVGFRHGHYVSFSKSDLYFLCTLRPLSSDVVEQKGEIEAAKDGHMFCELIKAMGSSPCKVEVGKLSTLVGPRGPDSLKQWMPLEEFRSQSFYTEHNARRNMLDLCVASWDGLYTGFKASQLQSSSLARPTQYFFHENKA